jgi:hypothetical protein
VPERDVVHVEQYLVLALAVPHLAARIARVGEDRADGVLGPGDPGPVPVAVRVVGGRARDALSGQPFGDGVDAGPGEEFGEDPPDHGSRRFVDAKDVQALAVCGLGRVGVRAGVDQQVTVGWAPAEVAALCLGLGGHGGADADLDSVPFAFAEAAEGRHDHVVGLVVRVDRAADLGDPQRHPVVREEGEGVAELVAVERPLRLPDNDRLEPAVGVS